MIEKNSIDQLKSEAHKAIKSSYAPYSKFKVGAALMDSNGNVFSGCNVENLVFPSSICAEATTIVKARSELGEGFLIDALVIYTPTPTPTSPCGNCRQIIKEHGHPGTRIIAFCDSDEVLDCELADLFPHPPGIEL